MGSTQMAGSQLYATLKTYHVNDERALPVLDALTRKIVMDHHDPLLVSLDERSRATESEALRVAAVAARENVWECKCIIEGGVPDGNWINQS